MIADAHRLQGEVDKLQGQVSQLEKERGAQPIDSALIAPSRWANRHEASFSGADFDALKEEIQDACGNVQPIKVRPLPKAKPGQPQYEIVFGHRRHRACLELGLPVVAVVEDLSDADLFAHMERENRNRKGLSAYEQGLMYRRAVDEKLFPSARQLAKAIGRSDGDIYKAMQIAMLPPEVVQAFPSPNDIQFRWAADLRAAVERDGKRVLEAAKRLASQGLAAADVFAKLTTVGVEQAGPGKRGAAREIDIGRGRLLAVSVEKSGATVLRLPPGTLPPEKWEDVAQALKALLT